MKHFNLHLITVVALLLLTLKSSQASIIVSSTQEGTIDGEFLSFSTLAVGIDGGVSGEYEFAALPALEAPWAMTWAITKTTTAIWAIEHFIRNNAFDGLDIDLLLETTTDFSSGHIMSSSHAITGTATELFDVASFSVISPALPLPLDPPNPIFMTTSHSAGGLGEVLIESTLMSGGGVFATTTATLTLLGNSGFNLSEPFISRGRYELFAEGSGLQGTYLATSVSEPSSMLLVGGWLVGAMLMKKRRKKFSFTV
jgi:hypothetical protein